MANIYKKKFGSTWIIRFSINSDRKTLYTGLKNKTIAQRLADKVEELKNSVLAGADFSPELISWIGKLETENTEIYEKLISLGLLKNRRRKTTLTDLLEIYEKNGTNKKESTQYKYEKTGRYLLQFFGKDKPIEEITIEDAERFITWFKTTPLNARSKMPKVYSTSKVNRETTAFKSVFKFAEDAGLIQKSPFRLLHGGASENPDTLEYVPAETVLHVIQQCGNPKWRAIFALGRFAGARGASDFSILTWDKIRFSSPDELGFIILEGKTSGVIPMNPVLEQCLADLFDRAAENEPKVFPDITSRSNINVVVRKQILAASVDMWKNPWYNLRKSFCTDVMESGVDMESYRRITRHSVNISLKHYQIYHKDRQARAANTLRQSPFMNLTLAVNPGSEINISPIIAYKKLSHTVILPSENTLTTPKTGQETLKNPSEHPSARARKRAHMGRAEGRTQGIHENLEKPQLISQTPQNTTPNHFQQEKENGLQFLANRLSGRYGTRTCDP